MTTTSRGGAGEKGGHPLGSPQRTVVMPSAGQAGVFGDPRSVIQPAPEVSRSTRGDRRPTSDLDQFALPLLCV